MQFPFVVLGKGVFLACVDIAEIIPSFMRKRESRRSGEAKPYWARAVDSRFRGNGGARRTITTAIPVHVKNTGKGRGWRHKGGFFAFAQNDSGLLRMTGGWGGLAGGAHALALPRMEGSQFSLYLSESGFSGLKDLPDGGILIRRIPVLGNCEISLCHFEQRGGADGTRWDSSLSLRMTVARLE